MKLHDRFDELEKRMDKLEITMAEMITSNRLSTKLIKYVILPLIVALAALTGTRLVFPF